MESVCHRTGWGRRAWSWLAGLRCRALTLHVAANDYDENRTCNGDDSGHFPIEHAMFHLIGLDAALNHIAGVGLQSLRWDWQEYNSG